MNVDKPPDQPLPLVPLATVVLCAVGVLAAVVIQGRSAPFFLLVIFLVWNIAPFALLGLGLYVFSRKGYAAFSLSTPLALVLSPLVLAATFYFVIWPRPAEPAAPFMIIPTLALLATLVIFGVCHLMRDTAK